MTPEQLDAIVREVVDAAASAENRLLGLLARRVRHITDEGGLAKANGEAAALRREVAKVVKGLRAERAGMFAAVLAAGYEESAAAMAAVGLGAQWGKAPAKRSLAALERDLAGRFAEVDRRVLRSAPGAFREVVGKVSAGGLQGEGTRRVVAQRALNAFAARGIPSFIDAAGKEWGLATYTEMATRTAATNAARQGRLDRMRERGRDLAVISGSSAGCPDCAPWEGEVVSVDGKTPGYPTLAEAIDAGLFHPNCTHQPDPYMEGVTDTSDIPHSDPERYQLRQDQRRLERKVRNAKAREEVAITDEAKAKARAARREAQAELRGHVKKHDLKRLYYREQVPKGAAMRATAKARA